MDKQRTNVIEELENACTKALVRTEGTPKYQSVSIVQPDPDIRVVCFEDESILDAIITMDTVDIADLIEQVNNLK